MLTAEQLATLNTLKTQVDTIQATIETLLTQLQTIEQELSALVENLPAS
jgi:Tfp pilus assembly protein PilO